jgi:DNA polymerase/3'-5' exonuclease PolX
MPRSEAQKLSDYVSSVAKKIFPEKDIRIETCGSFRRGREMCGDVDILITSVPKKGGSWLLELEEINGILPKLTAALKKGPDGKTPFLVQRLGADKIAKTGS